MTLDIYVKGQIVNVNETENGVIISGRFQYMYLYNECCDYDVILKLYNTRGYLKLYGKDLEVIKQSDDELKLKGKLSEIKVIDKSGTVLHDFDVKPCVVLITEMREDEEIDVTQPDNEIEVEEE